MGTSNKIYVENGGTFNDITPIRATFAAGTVSFTTSYPANTTTVLVTTTTAHGAANDDYVVFSGAANANGIPATSLNNVQFPITVVSPTTFNITVNTAATSAGAGGGAAIVGYFYIASGNYSSSSGTGWGVSPWGTPGGWGVAATTAVYSPLRIVYFASRYNSVSNKTDLLFNIRLGPIYKWAVDTSFQVAPASSPSNAVLLSGTAVPPQIGQILYDTYSGILMAFGATPYGGSVTYDSLLVRWASQDDYTNWDPASTYTSTAGFLKLQTGANILRAISNLGEILVFTESSVTSVTFTGGLDVFSQKLISADVSVMGPNAISLKNNVYYWMGTDKFFLYNGRVETIPCTLRQHVFEDINLEQSEQIIACSNERFFEVWWFYCSAASTTIDRYVIYNYAEDGWYYGTCTDTAVPNLDLSRTAWSGSPLRQNPYAASSTSNYLYKHEFGVDADAVAMTSYIQSNYLDIDDGDNFMLLRRLIPDTSFVGSTAETPVAFMGVQLTNFPGDTPAPYPFTEVGDQQAVVGTNVALDEYTEQLFIRKRGRQLSFFISSTSVGVNWQLGAVRMDIRPDGRRGYSRALSNAVYLTSNTTDGVDTMTALVEPPLGVSSATTDGTDIMSSLIGVNVAFTPVALYDAGLASSYPGSGTTWADISGNGRNATLVNPSYSSGAFTFSPANNGTDSGPYGVIPTSVPTALNVTPTTGFTVSIWFKMADQYGLTVSSSPGAQTGGPWYDQAWPGMLSSAPGYVLSPVYIGSVPPGSDTYISAWVNTGSFGYNVNNSATKNNARGLGPKAGRWYNLIYTYTGSSSTSATDALRLYIDGVLVDTNSIDASVGYLPITFSSPGTAKLNIGANSFAGVGGTPAKTRYMDGSIAVVSIYKPFLNASQVAALYNAYSSRFTNSTYIPVSPAMVTANAVAIYDTDVNKYDEIPNYTLTSSSNKLFAPPAGPYEQIETAFDFSGNGYDLTSVGSNEPYMNAFTITDPLNPDSPSTAYNFGGKGTLYGSIEGSLRYNTLTSGPLNTILTTDANFSVNIWYYHTWLGMTDRPQCISALSDNSSLWFTIGKPEGADPVGSISAAIAGNGIWYKTRTPVTNLPFYPSLLTWYQYTMTYNATSKLISLYVNGVLFSTASATGITRTVPTLKGIQIGGRWDNGFTNSNNTMRGNRANAQIYSSELTAAEVLQNYNHFLPRFI
jgi:hypothetical protein